MDSGSALVLASRFVTIDSTQKNLVFYSKDLSIMGTYNVRVQALEPRHGASKIVYFTVVLDCKVTQVVNSPGDLATRYFYTIGGP